MNYHLKDFFKFESSKLREDGKIEIEFSCFKCQTNQKAILKTSSIDATPYNLQFHMKKVHPQLVWKFYEATKSKRKRKERRHILRGTLFYVRFNTILTQWTGKRS